MTDGARKVGVVVLAEEYAAPDSEAMVGIALHTRSRVGAEKWMENKLWETRNKPEETAKWLEECLLRGLSELNRGRGAEHEKSTGRRAGGGTLTKGS